MSAKPICMKCQYYYITWDKVFPYGCKAIGFKSHRIPCTAVKESSGQECFYFVAKQKEDKTPKKE